jgi:hypothetical protein
MVALATALPLNSVIAVMGQQLSDGGSRFDLSPQEIAPDPLAQGPLAQDPLANYTKSTFVQYLNSMFRLSGGIYKPVDVTLTEVTDMQPANTPTEPGKECFTLLFRGESIALPQGTYTVDHAALGRFALFLVPAGADANGAQGYLATINRLPYYYPVGPRAGKRSGSMRAETIPAPPRTSPNQPRNPPGTVAPVPVAPAPNGKPSKQRVPRKLRGDYFSETDFDQ